jgi:nitrite reductase/ring-hydroxylating ferredoxin subunit
MIRRTFLASGLILAGFGRRVWAQLTTAPPRFVPLTTPIRIPLASVERPWVPVAFVGESVLPAGSATPGRRVLIKGVLLRKEMGNSPSALSALSVVCPHEQCAVALVTDPVRLEKMRGNSSAQPLFECACHFSKFEASEEGAWVSGVAYRGLFRFRIGSVSDGTVEISDIEDEALSVV